MKNPSWGNKTFNTFCDLVIVFLTILVSHGRTVDSFVTSCTFKTVFVPFLPSTKYLFSKVNSFSTSCTLGFGPSKFQRSCPVTCMDIHALCDPDLCRNTTCGISPSTTVSLQTSSFYHLFIFQHYTYNIYHTYNMAWFLFYY